MKKLLALVLCLTGLLTPSFSALAQTPTVSRNRLLFNSVYPMGEDEVPEDMVTLYSLSIVVSLAAIQLDREAASFARAMFNDMIDDGITNYLVVSGYRTYAKQQQLYADKFAYNKASGNSDSEAEVLAKSIVAVPGTSEHQSGYAMDISNTALGGTLSGNVEQSAVGQWLKENAWRFGYTMRYPKDKTEITGIVYEPWHYRFVGAPHAQILQERSLCLEEYVSLTKEEGRTITFTDAHGLSYSIGYADALPDLDLMEDGVIVNPVGAEGDGYLVTSIAHNPVKTPLRWN